MSCASRRVNGTFMRGCGSSSENASVSGLVANFRAITSNGGASAMSLRCVGDTIWQLMHRASARRLPLSASAAAAADTTRLAATIKEKPISRTGSSVEYLEPASLPQQCSTAVRAQYPRTALAAEMPADRLSHAEESYAQSQYRLGRISLLSL